MLEVKGQTETNKLSSKVSFLTCLQGFCLFVCVGGKGLYLGMFVLLITKQDGQSLKISV